MEEKKQKTLTDYISEHKAEILIVTGLILVYRAGFKRGYDSSWRAMDHALDAAAKKISEMIEVGKF